MFRMARIISKNSVTTVSRGCGSREISPLESFVTTLAKIDATSRVKMRSCSVTATLHFEYLYFLKLDSRLFIKTIAATTNILLKPPSP